MTKKFIIALIGLAAVLTTLSLVKAAQIKELMSAPHVQPVSAVTTTHAQIQNWNPTINSVGSLAPVQGVTISAELEGTVTAIKAENGAAVKAGDLLIELDTTVEVAQLEAAKARAELARLQRDRAVELRAKNTISQSELDSAAAQFAQSVADMAALQASIDKKSIRAPFDGRVGIRMVNLGQFVTRGTPLLPLQKLDPVFVDFYVPQRSLPLLGLGQAVNVRIDAFPQTAFTARISAINSVVDTDTRNVAVQAMLPNPDESLRAGMFAQLEVVLPRPERVVVIPTTAVAYASYGNSVYVVQQIKGPDGVEYLGARQQPVTLGAKRGDQVAVLEGLSGDEEVATSGIFKLRNGLPVQVNNDVQPTNSAHPEPSNT